MFVYSLIALVILTLTSAIPHLHISPRQTPETSTCIVQTMDHAADIVSIWIYKKTTPELGKLGSGLHDNLNGKDECAGVAAWQQPVALEMDPGTGNVTAYTVSFKVRSTNYIPCIQTAIAKAEGQVVKCQLMD